jgi:hypothetical protein
MTHTRTQKAIGLMTITAILMGIALFIVISGCSKSFLKLSNNLR